MVNYTEQQVESMVRTYNKNPTKLTVESLADTMGKTVRSIVAKLSNEGVYKKVATKKVSTATTMAKKSYVNVIKIMMNARHDQLNSLENVSKKDLEIMLDLLKQLNNEYEIKEMR